MRIKNALREFQNHLQSQTLNVATLTPKSGIPAMVSFYRDVRVEECSVEADEDMLLFQ
jgi:anionic cell wall polymer biosynthesis LytR-Cps2A-Psr (LCP) family protein